MPFVRKVLVATQFIALSVRCGHVGTYKVQCCERSDEGGQKFSVQEVHCNGITTVRAAMGKKRNLLLENGESIECIEELCYA